ncbi:Arc family DNA-binding protein [Oceanisphaera sp. KMM 10153]|uniref:Arc family DNA-binding protein n=1 Tax=Oceanisphaera submarina TaxID=3390193 RepID=UPI00397667CD
MQTRQVKPFGLRMQPELKALLQKLAKDNGRSLNSELIQRLKESVKSEKTEL